MQGGHDHPHFTVWGNWGRLVCHWARIWTHTSLASKPTPHFSPPDGWSKHYASLSATVASHPFLTRDHKKQLHPQLTKQTKLKMQARELFLGKTPNFLHSSCCGGTKKQMPSSLGARPCSGLHHTFESASRWKVPQQWHKRAARHSKVRAEYLPSEGLIDGGTGRMSSLQAMTQPWSICLHWPQPLLPAGEMGLLPEYGYICHIWFFSCATCPEITFWRGDNIYSSKKDDS